MSDTNPGGADVRYPHVVRTILETPWAILPSTLRSIIEAVGLRASGERFTDQELAARIGNGPSRKDVQREGSVAVIPVYGVITPRADLFTEMSGGTSVQRLQEAFAAAVDDKDVSAIVLDIDSPGGMTAMIPEFAADIRAARGKKPIVAVANTLAASAAYWIGSQADEFVASPSAEAGSIGVFAAHDDISSMQDKLGVKTTIVKAGKFKAEGNPFEPLSDEARAHIQERVDDGYKTFTGDVARGRGVPVEKVRAGFGEGRVLHAKAAVREGLVDRIETFESVVSRLMQTPGKTSGQQAEAIYGSTASGTTSVTIDVTKFGAANGGPSFTDDAEALRVSADKLVDRLTSLAEVQRGHLTVAKRERLTACTGALRESVAALEAVLADTDPDKHRRAFEEAAARHALEELAASL